MSGDEKVQIEPEVALWCELEYAGSRWWPSIPRRLAPTTTAPSVAPMPKRSARRRTGVKSKGLAANLLPLTHFAAGCELDDYRIACYLERDGELHPYGIDSAAVDYSYFHGQLLAWAIDKFNHQQDEGPAEHIQGLLAQAGARPMRSSALAPPATPPRLARPTSSLPVTPPAWWSTPASRYSESDIREAIRCRTLARMSLALLQAVRSR